ncbi:MAG: class I SAM-dependent methyltransferase [Pseudomonadota bacterium]
MASLLDKILHRLLGRPADSRAKELRELGALPTATWQAGRLGRLSPEQISAWMTDPESLRDYEALAPQFAELKLPELTGGVNPGDQRALYALIRALRPGRVLEIGTHIACSTVNIALALAANRAGETSVDGSVTSVDIRDVNDPRTRPWEAAGSPHSPNELMQRIGMADRVAFMVSGSLAFIETAPAESFDFIFLDGDHAATTVYQELPAALRLLRPGGLILLHDYFPGGEKLWDTEPLLGPYLAVERLKAEGAWLDVLPLGALPWPTKFGSTLTSLALAAEADRP